MLLAVLALISNTSPSSVARTQEQFARIYCPIPLYNTHDYLNNTYTYNNGGMYYQCFWDDLSVPESIHITMIAKSYNATAFGGVPTGWLDYVGDSIATFFIKVGAVGNLLSYFLTPIGFNILGYGFDDIGLTAQLFVIVVYVFMYFSIGAMAYKIISPFAGGGG